MPLLAGWGYPCIKDISLVQCPIDRAQQMTADEIWRGRRSQNWSLHQICRHYQRVINQGNPSFFNGPLLLSWILKVSRTLICHPSGRNYFAVLRTSTRLYFCATSYNCSVWKITINPHNAEIFLYKPWRPKGSVSSFCFI